jgi:hypothetical protein
MKTLFGQGFHPVKNGMFGKMLFLFNKNKSIN